jgi:hypothetical protein
MISIAYIVKNEADALNANFSNTYRWYLGESIMRLSV